jgi:hypothetical protein
MISVEIDYRPVRFIPWNRKLTCNFPGNWTELNSDQLVAIAGSRHTLTDDVGFLARFMGISRRIISHLGKFQILQIGEMLEWTKSVQPHNKFIIPFIGCGYLSLKAPLPKLKKVTFSQFIFADTCFADWQESESESDLTRFVACWYLPEGTVFSEEVMEQNAEELAKTEISICEAVAMNYLLVRQWLCDVYPLVFIPDRTAPDEKKKKKPMRSNGWIRIFEQVVGDDIIHADQYANQPLHNVLRFLSQRIKDNMKNK